MDDVRRDRTQKVHYGRGDRINYEKPVAALDLQLDLLSFSRTAPHTEMVDAFCETYNPALGTDVITHNPEAFRDHCILPGIHDALDGMAQYISAEMCQLVTDIAEEMPPEMLFPTDLQFQEGLLVLGKRLVLPMHRTTADETGTHSVEGMRLLERLGYPLKVAAIGYSQMPERMQIENTNGDKLDKGIQIFCYATQGDCYDFLTDRGDESVDVTFDRAFGPHSSYYYAPLILVDHLVWGYGSQWGEAHIGEVISSENTAPKVSYLRRWLLALWRLMWQEILHPDPFRLDRPAQKRAMRQFPHREVGDVLRVIRLRKIDETADEWSPDGGAEGRELSHGYWRRGHWRTLHRDTDTERKVYVKGHAVRPDLPQADSYKVVSVER